MMKQCKSNTYKIYICGNYDKAVDIIREFCEEGACFSVTKVDYIYTGGMESGLCVTRINYPRFPTSDSDIRDQVGRLAEKLRKGLFEDSYTIESATEMIWFSRRND